MGLRVSSCRVERTGFRFRWAWGFMFKLEGGFKLRFEFFLGQGCGYTA